MALTVLIPSPTQDLTTLRRIKLELGIQPSDSSQDALLTEYIHDASDEFASQCKRVFGQETVSETINLCSSYTYGYGATSYKTSLVLSRYPVVDIDSVTLDGVAVATSEYTRDDARGLLSRVYGWWGGMSAVIVYTGGYQLLDGLPRRISRAVNMMVKASKFSASRDPHLRSMNAINVLSETYGQGSSTSASATGQPTEVAAAIDYYMDRRIV